MLELLEKMLDLAHLQSKTRGNFWPNLAIFNLKVTSTFGPFKLKQKP